MARGVVSVQVLNEFAAVLRRKLELEWIVVAEAISDVRAALDPVQSVDMGRYGTATARTDGYGLSCYDSLIVAAALEAGGDTLLAEDLRTGQRLEGLLVVNPMV